MSHPFDRYYSFGELTAELERYAREYPQCCALEEIGRSHEGRPLWLVTVTSFATGDAAEKPAFYADANLHATEVAGTTTVLAIVDALLRGFAEGEPRIVRLLERTAFYLVPRANPDGAERIFADPPELLRSGTRRYPFDELEEGLHVRDVDGDGRILQMRIADPAGDWKESSLHPQLLEKRGPGEHGGKYYRLLAEGMIERWDGYLVRTARPEASLDFNRNFPYGWRAEGEQFGAGPFPTSEPEVRAIVSFVTSHPNINTALCYHTFSGLLLRPYDDKADDVFEQHDLWLYERLAALGSELTGYRAGAVQELLRYHPKEVITGTEDSWLFDSLGVLAWTVELWDIVGAAGIEREKPIEWFRNHPHSDDLQILEWYRGTIADGDGYVDWRPFEHPQLGPVEIGGWNKLYSWRNPPHRLMGREAEKNIGFALLLGDVLPDLETVELSAAELSPGVYLVRLIAENRGFLPSYTTKRALKTHSARPLRYEMTLPDGASILSGKEKGELGHLEGRSNKLDSAAFSFTTQPTDNRAKVEWTITSPAGGAVRVRWGSERAGWRSSILALGVA